MSASRVALGGPLEPEIVAAISREGVGIELCTDAVNNVEQAHHALQSALGKGAAIYGASTGVGTRDGQGIDAAQNAEYQLSLLRSHATGVGPELPQDRVRAMMSVRVSQLAMGRSGISLPTLEALVAMVDRHVTPQVPSLGSVGAADLAPLAHAALPLIGEGRVSINSGPPVSGALGMQTAKIALPKLSGRDALAWINSPAEALGSACLVLVDLEQAIAAAEIATALTMASLGCSVEAQRPASTQHKAHPGALQSASHLCELLPQARRRGREALCFRNAHHVLGALREAAEALRKTLRIELSCPTDNPIWIPEEEEAFSGGGALFDTHRLAQVLDAVADALTASANLCARHVDRLMSPELNGGLPPFLMGSASESLAISSGLMIVQYTAVALVARMRASGSANALSAPTCAGFEDVVSLAPLSAERAINAIDSTFRIIAIELIAAAQAVDLSETKLAPRLLRSYDAVRDYSPFVSRDRPLGVEIDRLAHALREGILEPSRYVAAAQ